METQKDDISNEEIKSYKNEIKVEFNKWIPLVRKYSDDFLRKLVKDIDDGIVYTDKHAVQANIDIASVFMILAFLFNNDEKKKGDTESEKRKAKIYNILLEQEKTEYFKSIGITEEKAKSNFIESIGMIYEYTDKSNAVSINGQPCFFSCNFLSKEDSVRFWELYKEYINIKDKLLKDFGMSV